MLVQSVDRALAILELIGPSRQGLGVSQIAEAMSLNVSTTHHILRTLQRRGYLRQDQETRRYALAHKVMHLANRFWEEISLISVAFPYLQRLQAVCGESIRLGVLERAEVLILVRLDVSEPRLPRRNLEDGMPVHCTALGKALLAGLPPDELRVLIRRTTLREYTPRTITRPEALEDELSVVRGQGFALSNQEYVDWVVSVAAPITDATASVRAAVSIACPVHRDVDSGLHRLASQVIGTARRISAALKLASPSPECGTSLDFS